MFFAYAFDPTLAFAFAYRMEKKVSPIVTLRLRTKSIFQQVDNGSKVVDCRIRYSNYANIKVGHIVSFTWKDSVTYKRVTGVFVYKDFKSMLQAEGVRSCLPHLKDGDYERGVRIYHSFRNYEASAKRYGVVAFRITNAIVSTFVAFNRRQQNVLKTTLNLTGWY